MTEEKSELVLAIEKIERPTWEFSADFLCNGKNELGKFRMRILTGTEQKNAWMQADAYMKREAKDLGGELARDIMANVKAAYLIHAATLHHTKTAPAFPSGKWAHDTFTPDQLTVLMSHYHECLRLSGAIDLNLDDDKIEGLAAIIANHYDSDAPNVVLTSFTEPQLGEIVVRLSKKLLDARAELAKLAPTEVT